MMKKILKELLTRYPMLAECTPAIEKTILELIALYRAGGTLYLCGNGGSAADAEHITGELLKGFRRKRPMPEGEKAAFAAYPGGGELAEKLQKGLRAFSLLSHPAFLSAFGNDVAPEMGYAQQLYALGRKGDIVLGISTSGGAVNVRNAFIAAKVKGMITVLLTGNRRGICEKNADIVIAVPESETYLIQELHLPVYHAICAAVESALFES